MNRSEPETRVRILRERARALARVPSAPADVASIEVVEFLLAYERYAIETRWVREVVALRELTPLPGTPAFVAGLVNVRGRIVAVIDLASFFDLPPRGLPDLNRVLVVTGDGFEFGLLVDAVPGLRRVPLPELQPPPPTFRGVRADYLRGLTADALAVLDGARIAADPRIVVRAN